MSSRSVLEVIEQYLDAAPRSSAQPEEVGKFTLFRPLGPWPYYARPRLGLTEPFSRVDVEELRRRQRALSLPQSIEWIIENTPSLADAVLATGMHVARYPLMVLDTESHVPVAPPDGSVVRIVAADDPDFARVHSVAQVGFAVPGTAVGAEGTAERDAQHEAMPVATIEFMRGRARNEVSVSAAAFDESGPVAVATHQPVGATTEVVGVATLPAARRRGLAAAVTSMLVGDAISRGVTTIFLSAGSDDVARVYERVGFRRIGVAGSAEPRDDVVNYANGNIKHRGAHLDGQMHGQWEFYRLDGSLMRSGSFDRGRQVGMWRTFDRAGAVIKETKFAD